MQRMILATAKLSDAATLTGSASSGDLDISNLKRLDLKQPYRAMGSAVFVQADLGASKLINTIAIIGHSGSSRSYARVTASIADPAIAAPDYDSGLLPFRSHQSGYDAAWALTVPDEQQFALGKNMFFVFIPAGVSCRYFKIQITDPAAAYIDMGRLYIAKAFQPTTNLSYGLNEVIVDPSRKNRTKTGVPISTERPKYRTTGFSLNYATKDQMFAGVYPIELLCGRTRDVLFVPDPDEKDYLQYRSYYGCMESIQPITNTSFQLYSKSFTVEEIPA